MTYELPRGNSKVKDIWKVLQTLSDGIIHIKYDHISMKTKLNFVNQLVCLLEPIRFDEKSSFKTVLELTPYWD